MVINKKTRLMLAGAVVGASMLSLAVANAQFDPSTGAPTTTPGVPQTTPGVSPPPGSVPPTQPSPYDTGTDAGTGGSGAIPTYPSPFGATDAGVGGSGLMPPSSLGTGSQDAGLF
ncbi:hypothetical protein F0U60_39740 [Archangium minus]|uniref:Uncharacterized protein n=1 Tax=Archangium minus TaxID=83450 RepID=A0ABY9X2I7_9BACT|nr:hypothetical protein F0U61_39370 [Archangium violaceum]WNG49578.1 hypothetical protein F0U60_39740 [Archangium minus]